MISPDFALFDLGKVRLVKGGCTCAIASSGGMIDPLPKSKRHPRWCEHPYDLMKRSSGVSGQYVSPRIHFRWVASYEGNRSGSVYAAVLNKRLNACKGRDQ